MVDEQNQPGERSAWAEVGDVLARYGDIPVAYAVFRVMLNDNATEVVDVEYVHVNHLYLEWLEFGDVDLVGRSFLEAIPDASTVWFPYCYRAAVLHESSHDVIYSPETDSWLTFNVEPSPIEGCCVFAFVRVNEEHKARELIEAERETSDDIIDIAGALNDEMGYDASMNALLETMSRVIHPERLYIFERWEHTTDNTFEWCAPGVEPQIDMLQNLDNSEFDTWDRMLATDSVVVIPDVSAYKGVDDRLYELLSIQGIDRLLAVPFYDNGKLIGYMGADNYAVEERLDTRRLLETIASFVSARMANRRLMDTLEEMGIRDSLTGILNRRGIDAAIQAHMESHEGEPFVIALMDVDDFKSINDLYGHAVGDEALRMLSNLLQNKMPEDAIVGRNGGDEALVMFPNESAQNIEEILADLMKEDLSFELDGECYVVTISVGYSWCDGSQVDLVAAYSRADAALYSVKYNGKSGYRGFVPGMEDRFRLQMGFASRNVVENLPEATVVINQETAEILYANDALVELIGCENLHEFMEFSKGEIENLLYPDDRQRTMEAIKVQSEQKTRLKLRLATKAGAEKEVVYSGRRVELANGTPAVFSVLFDLE